MNFYQLIRIRIPSQMISQSMSLAVFMFGCTLFFQNSLLSQVATPPDSGRGGSGLAIQRVNSEYDSHVAKQTGFESTYQRIGMVLNETEVEMGKIQNEGIQQQFALSNLAFQSLQIGNPNRNPSPPSINRQGRNEARAVQNAAVAEQNRIGIESTIRTEQLRQLSATQQAIVRRRMEASRDFEKLQQEVSAWQQKWPALFDPYWRHTDPEGMHTKRENEEVLVALKLRAPNNVPAMIAQGIVEIRLGQSREAVKTLDEAIRTETSLNVIAFAARSLAHSTLDEKQKSKADLQKAIAAAPKNSYLKWLRADLAASQGDFSTAKKELSSLLTVQDHEIGARRFLAVLIAIRPGKSSKDSADALKHAQLASDLSGDDNWYSELVLSMAMNVAGKTEEALAKANHANELAKEESTEKCRQVIDWIKKKESLDWTFVPMSATGVDHKSGRGKE